MKLVGEITLAEKKNLSEMIRKFAEIQGIWRKQKKKGRLTLLKHAVTT